MRLNLLIILGLTLCSTRASAHADSLRIYTESLPLVYEDVENLWPYAYLNAQGEPEGFNIDLVRLLMSEMHIPYVIRLKPQMEVLDDLKARRADLTIGLASVFEKYYGLYGSNPITLLTQSVATPRNKPVAIRAFRDLGAKGLLVTVSDSSLCHHLMTDYGWGSHAIVSKDMSQAIRELNDSLQGQIVWNTLSLQWLIEHYGLDNLRLSPVNMPHGENKFMSYDQHLLSHINKTFAELCAADGLAPLEKKWFYPNYKQQGHPLWQWGLAALAVLLLALTLYYLIRKLMQSHTTTKADEKLGLQLAKMAQHGKIRAWEYHVEKQLFTWIDSSGKAARSYTTDDFAKRYGKRDFARLKEAIDKLATQAVDAKGHRIKELELELKARDAEAGDDGLRHFVAVLSVLSRHKSGEPEVILCTKKDVTREHHLRQVNNERSLRFWSMFYNDEAGVIYFNKDGHIGRDDQMQRPPQPAPPYRLQQHGRG